MTLKLRGEKAAMMDYQFDLVGKIGSMALIRKGY